jgi:hypothetical protein
VIESPDVGSASSDLGKAQADLIAAEHDFAREQELFAAHAASQRDYQPAQLSGELFCRPERQVVLPEWARVAENMTSR